MIRKIIKINEEACNGCGACATACHEGAIAMVDGKARLIKEEYCDGLGDCLPACPTGAITFEEREAPAYDQQAVEEHLHSRAPAHSHPHGQGCPGSQMRSMAPREAAPQASAAAPAVSQLGQWPVQIQLAPVKAPFFQGAKLLVAADCTAYAYGSFHQDFIRGRVTLIGCPKLDNVDYAEKLTEILKQNDIQSVTVVRMEVPCCGGIENAVKRAMQASGKWIPWNVVTVRIDGTLAE